MNENNDEKRYMLVQYAGTWYITERFTYGYGRALAGLRGRRPHGGDLRRYRLCGNADGVGWRRPLLQKHPVSLRVVGQAGAAPLPTQASPLDDRSGSG